MPNNRFTIKQGATGAVLVATLSDENGEVDLTDFSAVTMTALSERSETPAIDAEPCVIDPDQETNPGVVRFNFDSDTANIAVGEYLIEFRATNASGVHIFPTGGMSEYGRLAVTAPLV
jgi:hypothetical protein